MSLGRILNRQDLVRAVQQERSAGRRIALANGIFDLLNSDASAQSLKGPGRPLTPAGERCEILAALEGVDYVTVFEEPTAQALIHAIAPDVHCKGTDYTSDTVPEREAVRQIGGRVAIVGDAKEHATRDLIRIILDRFRSSAG